jgi:hypothetical protein
VSKTYEVEIKVKINMEDLTKLILDTMKTEEVRSIIMRNLTKDLRENGTDGFLGELNRS